MNAIIVALLILLVTGTSTSEAYPSSAGKISISDLFSLRSPRSSITIDGDGGFTSENGVVSGSGLPWDPFIIERWTIVAPTPPDPRPWAVGLLNTTRYAVVRDNALSVPLGTHGAVFLYNVSHVSVEHNDILDSGKGIGIRYSNQVDVRGNRVVAMNDHIQVFGLNVFGIVASDSREVSLSNNYASGVVHGVSIVRTRNALVENNIIQNGLSTGITILESPSTEVAGNFIRDCSGGIYVNSSQVLVARNTLVSLDGGTGISAFDDSPTDRRQYNVTNVSVLENRVEDGYEAIFLACLDCVVSLNDFVDNEFGGSINSRVNVTLNNFIRNSAPLFLSGNVVLYMNNLENGSDGLLFANNPVDARYNWWGSPEGPAPGDVEGSARYSPWLQERVPEAGAR